MKCPHCGREVNERNFRIRCLATQMECGMFWGRKATMACIVYRGYDRHLALERLTHPEKLGIRDSCAKQKFRLEERAGGKWKEATPCQP